MDIALQQKFKERIAPFMASYNIDYICFTLIDDSQSEFSFMCTDTEIAHFLGEGKNYKLSILLSGYNNINSDSRYLKPEAKAQLKTMGYENFMFCGSRFDKNFTIGMTIAAKTGQPIHECDYLYDQDFPMQLKLYLQKNAQDLLCNLRNNLASYEDLKLKNKVLTQGLNLIKGLFSSLIKKNYKTNLTYHFRGKTIKLSKAEVNCLKQVALQFSYKHISETLKITVRGIEFHVKNIKDKTGCKNRRELTLLARENGLISLAAETRFHHQIADPREAIVAQLADHRPVKQATKLSHGELVATG